VDDERYARCFFAAVAPAYPLVEWLFRASYRRAVELLVAGAGGVPLHSALDVGTGTGLLAGVLAERLPAVTGVDTVPAMLRVARRRHHGRVSFLEMDATCLDFPPASFDVAAAGLVLHGMAGARRQAVLEEMRRVARHRLLVIDYIPHRNPLVQAIEFVERGHYREIIAEIPDQLRWVGTDLSIHPLNPVLGAYLVRLGGQEGDNGRAERRECP
jgi:ubiquinone/menaquinone biosynthesis C-methylase UbiE